MKKFGSFVLSTLFFCWVGWAPAQADATKEGIVQVPVAQLYPTVDLLHVMFALGCIQVCYAYKGSMKKMFF